MSEQTTRTPADEQDFAGAPRPDAMLPALDEGQLEALRQVGREWDQVSAEPRAWRQALPVDPALGEYPKASEFRPARFTRLVPVAGRDGDLPPIETTSAAETPLRPAARVTQRVTRAIIGPSPSRRSWPGTGGTGSCTTASPAGCGARWTRCPEWWSPACPSTWRTADGP